LKFRFNYVDGQIGSGKSFSSIAHMIASPNKVTIGTKTNDQSAEFRDNLIAAGVSPKDIRVIKRESVNGKSANKRYAEYVHSDVKFLIINQSVAFKQFDKLVDRDLYMDEVFDVVEIFHFKRTSQNYKLISEDVKRIRSPHHPDFYHFLKTPKIAGIADDGWESDDLAGYTPQFHKLCRRIDSAHFDVESDVTDVDQFIHAALAYEFDPVPLPKEKAERAMKMRLRFYAVMRPSILAQYKSVTIIGANFPITLLASIWGHDVEFVPHPTITAGLRYQNLHHKGHQTTIYYISERTCSKTLLDSIGQQVVFDAAAKTIGTLFTKEEHIFCVNNTDDVENPYRWLLEGTTGHRVSPDPRGLNAYKHINMCVQLAALNNDPATFAYYDDRHGISAEHLRIATTLERYYQFCGRISLRVLESEAPITLIVFDRATAIFMQHLTQCKDPIFLDIGIEELTEKKAKFRTDEEKREAERQKKATYRAKKKAKAAAAALTA
jgi:hypothetical protein